MITYEGLMRINAFLSTFFRMMWLNVLWLATVLAGLVVFGFGPANYALASYVDGWFRRGQTPPVARTFFAAVRAEFWRSAVMGWIILAAHTVIVTNIFYASVWIVQFANVVALFVLVVATMYSFPVAVATDIRPVHKRFGAALMIGFGSLHYTIIATAVTAGVYWMVWKFALPLLPLLLVAVPATCFGLAATFIFRRLTAEADETTSAASTPRPQFHTAKGITQ